MKHPKNLKWAYPVLRFYKSIGIYSQLCEKHLMLSKKNFLGKNTKHRIEITIQITEIRKKICPAVNDRSR